MSSENDRKMEQEFCNNFGRCIYCVGFHKCEVESGRQVRLPHWQMGSLTWISLNRIFVWVISNKHQEVKAKEGNRGCNNSCLANI